MATAFLIGASVTAGLTALGYVTRFVAKAPPSHKSPDQNTPVNFEDQKVQEAFKATMAALKKHMDKRDQSLWRFAFHVGNPDDPIPYQAAEEKVAQLWHWMNRPHKSSLAGEEAEYEKSKALALKLLKETHLIDEPKAETPPQGLDTLTAPLPTFPVSSPLCRRIHAHYPQIGVRIAKLLGLYTPTRVKYDMAEAITCDIDTLLNQPDIIKIDPPENVGFINWLCSCFSKSEEAQSNEKAALSAVKLADRIKEAWDIVEPFQKQTPDREADFRSALLKIATQALRILQPIEKPSSLMAQHFPEESAQIKETLAYIRATYTGDANPRLRNLNANDFDFARSQSYLEHQDRSLYKIASDWWQGDRSFEAKPIFTED